MQHSDGVSRREGFAVASENEGWESKFYGGSKDAYEIRMGGDGHQVWWMYGGRILADLGEVRRRQDGFLYIIQPTMLDGRLVCGRLVIERLKPESPAVSSEAVRAVNVSKWLGELTDSLIAESFPNRDSHWTKRHTPPPADFAKDGPTDEALDVMAQHYAWLMVQGRKPSGEFLRDYGMPRSTSSKWISLARKRGILVDEHRRER